MEQKKVQIKYRNLLKPISKNNYHNFFYFNKYFSLIIFYLILTNIVTLQDLIEVTFLKLV